MCQVTNNGALRAFTVMEVLISMLVTAIILSVVFVIFSILSQRMADFTLRNEPVAEMNRFTYCINKDIFESEEMHVTDSGIAFKEYLGASPFWKCKDGMMVRTKSDFTDTFHLKQRAILLDSVYGPGRERAFQRLTIQIVTDSIDMRLRFYKPLFPAGLLNCELP